MCIVYVLDVTRRTVRFVRLNQYLVGTGVHHSIMTKATGGTRCLSINWLERLVTTGT